MDDVELDFRLGARSEARCLPLRCLHTHKDFAVLKGDRIGRALDLRNFRCNAAIRESVIITTVTAARPLQLRLRFGRSLQDELQRTV